MTVIDTVFKALAPAIPERTIAGHHADLVIAHGQRHLAAKAISSSPIWARVGGGWGAKSSEDGVSVTVCINDGDTHNTPVGAGRGKISAADRALFELRTTAAVPGRRAAVLAPITL